MTRIAPKGHAVIWTDVCMAFTFLFLPTKDQTNMLRLSTLALVAALLSCTDVFATTWTVSNNPNKPAQKDNLQTAIDEAQEGDTLLVYGGGADYGNITLNKQLRIIGEGIGHQVQTPTVSTFYMTRNTDDETISSSGSIIEGMKFIANFYVCQNSGDILNNIAIRRCQLPDFRIAYSSGTACSDVSVEECYLTSYIRMNSSTPENATGLRFLNCVMGAFASDYATAGVLVANCWMYNQNITGQNILWAENMFINCSGGPLDAQNQPDSDFSRNLVWGGGLVDYFMNPDNNFIGSNNLVSVNPAPENEFDADPLFTNYTGGYFNWNHDFTLQAGSPAAANAAQGLGEIGLGGGLAAGYFNENGNLPQGPRGPEVTSISTPSVTVSTEGTLSISGSAKARQ